jgi:hypothetical protein
VRFELLVLSCGFEVVGGRQQDGASYHGGYRAVEMVDGFGGAVMRRLTSQLD